MTTNGVKTLMRFVFVALATCLLAGCAASQPAGTFQPAGTLPSAGDTGATGGTAPPHLTAALLTRYRSERPVSGSSGGRVVFRAADSSQAYLFGQLQPASGACWPWAGTVWGQVTSSQLTGAAKSWLAVTAIGPSPAEASITNLARAMRIDKRSPAIEETVVKGAVVRRLSGGEAMPRGCRHTSVQETGPAYQGTALSQYTGRAVVHPVSIGQPVAEGFATRITTRASDPVLWIETFRVGGNALVQLVVWAWPGSRFTAAELAVLASAAYQRSAHAVG